MVGWAMEEQNPGSYVSLNSLSAKPHQVHNKGDTSAKAYRLSAKSGQEWALLDGLRQDRSSPMDI
jgi:hypothetical protein